MKMFRNRFDTSRTMHVKLFPIKIMIPTAEYKTQKTTSTFLLQEPSMCKFTSSESSPNSVSSAKLLVLIDILYVLDAYY